MDFQRLRRETEADHRAVEGALSLMNPELDTVQYIRCLRRLYGLVAGWEGRAFEIAPEWIRPMLAERQRKRLLELDLAWFGASQKGDRHPALPPMNDLPSLLGTMYVMEGSTLGGQLIARHVEKTLHLTEGQGDAFFRGHGDRTGPMWQEFCGMLNMHVSDDRTDTVVMAAKAMFSTFGDWMREESVIDGS